MLTIDDEKDNETAANDHCRDNLSALPWICGTTPGQPNKEDDPAGNE